MEETSMIEIESVATLAKSFSVKREKDGDDAEHVIAHLKFSETFVSRDTIDEICGQAIGWSTMALFDEQGAPLFRCDISLPSAEWSCTATISGPDGRPSLKVAQATLDSAVLTPTTLGAVLAGQLSWVAKGDEVEDVTDMLGAVVTFHATLNGSGQVDAFKDAKDAARAFVHSVAEAGGGSIKGNGIDVQIPAAKRSRRKAAEAQP
jgi:hypothetical protein